MDNPKILIVVTSSDKTKNDKPTGLHLEEFSVPYNAFKKADAEITVASTQGGKAPTDPNNPPTDKQKEEWSEAIQALEHTKKVAELDPSHFDAVYFPGGHGTMFDFPNNPHISGILEHFDANHKVIAAICHGPAAFIGAKKSNGQPFAKDRTINSFTDSEEDQADMIKEMPFLLETALREAGADFRSGPEFEGFVIKDENLITGQNPKSAPELANEVLAAIPQTITSK